MTAGYCGARPAAAARLVGYIDSLTAYGAVGWACGHGSTGPMRIQVNAGDTPLGVYPAIVPRPDAASFCGEGGAHGFAISFDYATRAQLAGQVQISVVAAAWGAPALLLPPSSRRTANPLMLPTGMLLGTDMAGLVEGRVIAPTPSPLVQLFAGGPPVHGVGGAPAAAPNSGGRAFTFQMPVTDSVAAPGTILPLFATVADAFGVGVPFVNALVLAPGADGGAPGVATVVPISAQVVQSGAVAGITAMVFTHWLAAGLGVAGLNGHVTLGGTDPSFREALVSVGSTADTYADCARRNGTHVPGGPPMTEIWAGIVKNNAAGAVTVPVNVALPFTVAGPVTASGTCLLTVIDAGYAYLDPARARYAATVADLNVLAVAASAAGTSAIPMGIETRFPAAAGALSVFEGFRADRALTVAGLSATVSAASVVGAPPSTGWAPAPPAGWGAQTEIAYLPAAASAAAHYAVQASNGHFSAIRLGKPGPLAMPAGAVSALQSQMLANGTLAVQRSVFKAFLAGTAFDGTMRAGDCLIAFETVYPGTGVDTGVVDLENQSVAYVRWGE